MPSEAGEYVTRASYRREFSSAAHVIFRSISFSRFPGLRGGAPGDGVDLHRASAAALAVAQMIRLRSLFRTLSITDQTPILFPSHRRGERRTREWSNLQN